MQFLMETILKGWPMDKASCHYKVHEFWNFRDMLTVNNGVIYKGTQIVMPKALHRVMLMKIHEGHLGIEKCKRRAREVMYWPGINQDIANTVSSCSACITYQNRQQAEPLHPHEVTERPWQKLGADLFMWQDKNYLLITDYYSSYPEMCTLKGTGSKPVIDFMKATFARHGVPDEVFTDNGPQFSSSEFKQFSEEWDFKHNTSSPYFPQSNGLVENSVQT
jgi:hypothetical protein